MNYPSLIPLTKNTVKYGVISGLGFCLYTTTMWLTKLDTTYLRIGQYCDIAIILLPIVCIFRAISQEYAPTKNTFLYKFIQRLGIAILVSLISFVLYDPFLYLYHHFINPTWFDAVIQVKKTELEAAHLDSQSIARQLQQMRATNLAQSGMFRLSSIIASVLVIPTFIAALSFAFVKKQMPRL